jgi:ComEC/Rec2-related protein
MLLESITALINNLFHEPQAGLLNGILFGVKATLDADLKQSLINSGTLHIIALSGMNISILVAIVNLVLLRVVRRPIANICTVVVIIGFISLVGISASVLRAAIMGTITLFAISFGRQAWPILAWILAVVIMLLINFSWIGDLSFQLSVMATLGIILFGRNMQREPRNFVNIRQASSAIFPYPKEGVTRARASCDEASLRSETGDDGLNVPPFRDRIEANRGIRQRQDPDLLSITGVTEFKIARLPLFRFLYNLVADDLRVSLAAQLFTVPIILFQFHRISLISPLSNILIGWLMAPIMVLGFATVAAGFLFWPLGQLLAWFTWVPLTFVLWVIDWTGKLPFASVEW